MRSLGRMLRRASPTAIPRWMAHARRRYAGRFLGVARIAGPGHIDYDTLAEVVLATVSEQPVARSSSRQSSPVVSL